MPQGSPWRGFWMGGFEGADHVNPSGQALDMPQASGHLDRLAEDHRRAAQAGLAVVRESIGWRLAENRAGAIDLTRALRIADSARAHGLQVAWTLMHYGVPEGLSLHDDALIARLARFAGEVARALRRRLGPGQVYTPVNEIGFVAWGAAQSGLFAPPNGLGPGHEGSSLVCGYTVKRRMARAALAAIDAIRAVDPDARFLHVEPTVHVVAPPDRPHLAVEAEIVRGWQWQAWDLIAGRLEPELGGRPDALDLVGVNHYHSGQWELITEERLAWHLRDPRRRPLADLLGEAWRRYERPLVVAETSHVGVGRADWLHDVAAQVREARTRGVPVQGMCLYPLVDRPDWADARHWHRSGLWHVAVEQRGARVIEPAYRAALAHWQRELPRPDQPAHTRTLIVLAARRWGSLPLAEEPVMEALAQRWRIAYVEPPLHDEAVPRLDVRAHGPALDVIVPHLPPATGVRRTGALLLGLLQRGLGGLGAAQPWVWPLDPQRRGIARAMGSAALCALELPRPGIDRLAWREAAARVPCSWAADEAQRLQAVIPPASRGQPRVGCIEGEADGERLDTGLLLELADALPDVQLVVVGPVLAHADPARRPNLHRLVPPPGALLPALLASWHAVLRPLRAAGRGAALVEALASGRPVIASGPAESGDEARLGVVRVAGVAALAAAVRDAIVEDPVSARRRERRNAAFLRAHDARAVAAQLHATLCARPPGAGS